MVMRHKMRYAVRDDACLSAASTGENQERTIDVCSRFALVWV